jgi:hypothetical protein
MAAAAGRYISAADLINRLTPTTYISIYDDARNNDVSSVNDAAVQLDIDSAEGEVDSYLITEQPLPLPALIGGKIDRLVKVAALDYAEALAWLRHPEYVRTFGENKRSVGIWERAEKRMRRIKDAVQELPDNVRENGKPGNVGGIILDTDKRMTVANVDGTSNSGDF